MDGEIAGLGVSWEQLKPWTFVGQTDVCWLKGIDSVLVHVARVR